MSGGSGFGSGGQSNVTGGSGGSAGVNAMLSLIGPRHIALKRDVVCRIDAEGVLACEKASGQREVVPGTFVDLTQDPYGFAAIRSDGVAVGLASEWFAQDDVVSGCESLDACTEMRPSRGKLVSIGTDGSSACGALDDGTVECWGPNMPASLPAGGLVRVIWDRDRLCGITQSGTARCYSPSASSSSDGSMVAEGAVQIGFHNDDILSLHSTGEVRSTAQFPEAAITDLPPLRFFDSADLTGITLDGEIATGSPQLSRIAPPSGPFVEVTTDGDEACALREDGSHVCWGGEWGNGADTEYCGLGQLGLRGTVAGQELDYKESTDYDKHLVGDRAWCISEHHYDLFVLRSTEVPPRVSAMDYEAGAMIDITGSAFLVSNHGEDPRVYCAGAGSTATKVEDELALTIENAIALGACGEDPIEGEYSSCEEVGCEVSSTFEGQVATSRVRSSESSHAEGIAQRVIVHEDGTVIRVAQRMEESFNFVFIFTPPDGPHGGNVYCTGWGIGPEGGEAPLSKLGTCVGASSSDTLEGCIRD